MNEAGGKSQYRTIGSIDNQAITRSVITVGRMPDDKEIRCFVHGKSNLIPPGKIQTYGFDEASGVVFLDPVDVTFDEMLDGKMNPKKQQKTPSQLDIAKQFITTALNNGTAAEIKALSVSAGISKNTLDRAKSALAIKSVKESDCWL